MKSKIDIQNEYQHYIEDLTTIKNSITNLSGGRNSQFSVIQGQFIRALEQELTSSTEEMENAINGTVWDKLTIAFFGETNAGKSTIIETFRILYDQSRKSNNDGNIVGDGRSDFTQTYEEYNLEINGRAFTLIDVPGIEGNEKVYEDGIKKALRRAHIVFYVHGHNIKPNEATAAKIKDYLGDWVNVYTIYNIRGAVSCYDEAEERITLYTDKVQEQEALIKETFAEVLGDVYKGNISLQGLLAMCAFANFTPEREDLIRNQQKLLSFFSNPQAILDFSQFTHVQELVQLKSQNYLEEIIKANEQKMYAMARRAEASVQRTIDGQQENTERLKETLRCFKRDISEIFSTTKNCINSRSQAEVSRHVSHLCQSIYKIIDEESDKEKKVNDCVRYELSKLSNDIVGIIADEMKQLMDKVEKKKRQLDAEYSQNIKILNKKEDVECNMNFDEALKELDISIGDCVDFVSSVIGGAGVGSIFTIIAPGVATAIGAIIGGALYGLRKLVFGNGGKAKAKAKVNDSLSNAEKELKLQVRNRTQKICLSLEQSKNEILKIVDEELNSLQKMTQIAKEASLHFNSFAETIN